MRDPVFRLVCVPSALDAAPPDWARDLLREGEIALVAGGGGLDAVDAVAHALDLATILVVRGERSPGRQEETVMVYAGPLPLVWVAPAFTDAARGWARDRGPMTLLVQTAAPLHDEERRRIDRFVATLGRQSE